LPEYLLNGASNQLRRDRSCLSSTSNYDDSSKFIDFEDEHDKLANLSTQYRSRSSKRYRHDSSPYSNKSYVLAERIIPVEHRRASLARQVENLSQVGQCTLDLVCVEFIVVFQSSPRNSLKHLAEQTGGVVSNMTQLYSINNSISIVVVLYGKS
jgi:hypothetical protein